MNDKEKRAKVHAKETRIKSLKKEIEDFEKQISQITEEQVLLKEKLFDNKSSYYATANNIKRMRLLNRRAETLKKEIIKNKKQIELLNEDIKLIESII